MFSIKKTLNQIGQISFTYFSSTVTLFPLLFFHVFFTSHSLFHLFFLSHCFGINHWNLGFELIFKMLSWFWCVNILYIVVFAVCLEAGYKLCTLCSPPAAFCIILNGLHRFSLTNYFIVTKAIVIINHFGILLGRHFVIVVYFCINKTFIKTFIVIFNLILNGLPCF